MLKNLVNIAISFTLVLLVSACGWHLRGALDMPAHISNIHLTGASEPLRNAIEKQLNANGIKLTNSAADAEYTLAITNEDSKRRTAALGSDALAAEYEYTESADFSLRKADGTLVGDANNIQVVRSVSFDSNQVLGAANETETVKAEMTRELASQLIRRMSFLAKQQNSSTTATESHGQAAP